MTENFIIVENVTEKDLEKILQNLANLYAETEYVNGIKWFRNNTKSDSFLILFSNNPDFDRFNFFVNYIKYPEEFVNFSPFVRGFYKTSDIQLQNEFNMGTWIMVYVSKNDQDYDNVTLVNEKNESYLFDFGGKIKKLESLEERFTFISVDMSQYDKILDIFPTKSIEVIKPSKSKLIKELFVIIVCLVFTVLGIRYYHDFKDLAIPTIFLFGLGFVALSLKFMKSIKF